MELVAGTYEAILLGYKLLECKLVQSFTSHAHSSCIKATAVSPNKYLATGSTDETIKVYDIRTRAEYGTLLKHDGSITCLQFHGNGQMFSSSEDGTICVWKTSNWDCVKTLRGHKSSVNWVAVHPSGKLALSVGKDKTLRTWDLHKGRQAFVINLKQIADQVHWSPNGSHYVVFQVNDVDVYDVETGEIICTFTFQHWINTLCFITNDVFAVGGESTDASLYKISKQQCWLNFKAHENRIRMMCCVKETKSSFLLMSASTDGFLKVWRISHVDEEVGTEAPLVAEVDTTCRLTCLTVVSNLDDKSTKNEETGNRKMESTDVSSVKDDSISEPDKTSSSTQTKRKRKREKMQHS